MPPTPPISAAIDPERVAAMLLYTHRGGAELYAESRQVEARLRGQADLELQWRMVLVQLRRMRAGPTSI
jgi:hypothetical protein